MYNTAVRKNDDVVEIDLIALIKYFWQRALVILIVMVACAIATIVYTFLFVKPKYDSTAVLIANNSNFSLGETSFSISEGSLSAASSLAGTYLRILESRTTLEQIIKESGVPYNYEQLSKMLSSQAYSDAKGMFEVTVRSSDPVEAETIANAIAKVLPDRIVELVDGSSVRIVDYAIVPAHAASPSYTKNTLIGALVGFLIIGIIYFARFMQEANEIQPLYTEADITGLFPEIPVLGVIPNVNSKNSRDGYYSSYYGAYRQNETEEVKKIKKKDKIVGRKSKVVKNEEEDKGNG